MRAGAMVVARAGWVVMTLVVVALGLAVRRWTPYSIGEHAGNVLWGVMWVLVVKVVSPGVRARTAGMVALAVVWGIECFQLTPWPARWSSESIAARYLLGGVFEAHDLIGNAIGVVAAAALIGWTRQPPSKNHERTFHL